MTRPRVVPDSPPRALGVIRVSKEREEMVSPQIQRAAIEDHCARRGYRVVGWIEGIDESGSRRRSPWWAKLDDAVSRVEAKAADVIVVWRFDRTSRNRLRWAVAIDRLEVTGGLIESATEPLDTSTASGRFARGMLAEMAAYRAEEIGGTWREVHARRTSMGLPANGKPRFGYEVVAGRFVPDPKTGPVLASLYRRYIAGESVYALVEWLNREGFRTAPGYSAGGSGPWSQMTLRRVLDGGFGAGLIKVAGELRPGAHAAVIDATTWEQFRAARLARRTLRRSERSEYLLSGLVRCAYPLAGGKSCGSSMGGGQFGSSRKPKFRCLAAAAQRRHPGGYVMMPLVEAAVMDWLAEQAADVDPLAEAVGRRSPGRRRERDADATAREIAKLERQLVNLTVQLSAEVVSERVYRAAREEIEAEIGLLQGRHGQELLAASRAEAGPLAARLLEDWGGLLVAERRAILRRLIRCVEVLPGRPVGRVEVVPRWR